MNEPAYTVRIVNEGRIVLTVGSNLTRRQALSLVDSIADSSTYGGLGRVVIALEV